jgi:hypothetical protein
MAETRNEQSWSRIKRRGAAHTIALISYKTKRIPMVRNGRRSTQPLKEIDATFRY